VGAREAVAPETNRRSDWRIGIGGGTDPGGVERKISGQYRPCRSRAGNISGSNRAGSGAVASLRLAGAAAMRQIAAWRK